MFNNKGIELAIGTVTIIALTLLVLVIVTTFFFSSFSDSSAGVDAIVSDTGASAGDVDVGGKIDALFARCGEAMDNEVKEYVCCEDAVAGTYTKKDVTSGGTCDAGFTEVKPSFCTNPCLAGETQKVLRNCIKCLS